MDNIIQWNIQSYKTKFSELKCILKRYQPICVCLQETMLNNNQHYSPSGYSLTKSDPVRDDGHERGTAILVNNHFNYKTIDLQTNLQACAIRLISEKTYTICSLYLPFVDVNKQEIDHLLDQLPEPFLLLGDMNAKSPQWGCNTTDNRGKIFEQLLLERPISVLNDGAPTHYHIQTGTSSVIDLSITSSDCVLDFNYSIDESLHDSDHYPIVLTLLRKPNIGDRPDKLDTDKADWSLFYELTATDDHPDNYPNIDHTITALEHIFSHASSASIPTRAGTTKRVLVPWWTQECSDALRERKLAERAQKRNPSLENKIRYNRFKARCRYIFNAARKNSWKEYVNSINKDTPPQKVWKVVQKISRKHTITPQPMVKDDDGVLLRTPEDVANRLVEEYARVSRISNYPRDFQNFKNNVERNPIRFTTRQNFEYNRDFTALTEETSPGQDGITYSMIKNCHASLLIFILNTFNRILREYVFPTPWRTAIIIPILKADKDPQIPSSYRPISLTSCLCKLMEKMINSRLCGSLKNATLSLSSNRNSGETDRQQIHWYNLNATYSTRYTTEPTLLQFSLISTKRMILHGATACCSTCINLDFVEAYPNLYKTLCRVEK